MTLARSGEPRRPRVLCVDDEPHVLDGLMFVLRRRFEVTTCPSGAEGLAALEKSSEGFAVVMSDMRMPVMSGAQFLARVRQGWPQSVRMLLTGQTDINAAILAVNEGQIFRFLSKPCPAEPLIGAVDAAVEQHRLVTAERVLLEQTLHGSIKALTDILALQNPMVFGRATRAKAHVSAMVDVIGTKERWPVEVAAMLSQIGTITLPPETAEKLYEGRLLSASEQVMVKRLPAVTERLLANIPRLEPVREILLHHETRFDDGAAEKHGQELPPGARLLKIVLDFDVLETQGVSRNLALETLRGRSGLYDPELLQKFGDLLGQLGQTLVVKELTAAQLRPGMVFVDDVRSRVGALLIARGHEVTDSLIDRIRNFSGNLGLAEPLRVSVPSGGGRVPLPLPA